MFTRHLYEAEEVLVSLRWCIRQGRTQEALFWCFELLESEMQEELKQELYSSWIWLFGISCLSAIQLLQEENYYEFVYALARLPKERRDRSILILLLFGSNDIEQPDRLNEVTNLSTLLQEQCCSPLESAFLSAVYQGKSRLAFDLSRPLWQENPIRLYTLLQLLQEKKHKSKQLTEILTLLEFQSTESWATRACAIASVCLDIKRLQASLQPLSSQLPPSLVATIQEWKERVGRRGSRIYAIPHDCLYKVTKRGVLSNKETTLERLYNVSEETLQGCPFWNRILEEEIPWLDDERKMDFYDQFFPDDIPDEWSRADQEKSHGYGCLINNEVPNNQKYTEKWYRNMTTRTYWCNNRDMQKYVAAMKEKEWDSLLDQDWSEIVSTWCLTPVKRRLLVVDA